MSLLLSFIPLVIVIIFFYFSTRFIRNKANKYPPVFTSHDVETGIGGWLLFLVFCLLILAPLFLVGGLIDFVKAEEADASLLSNEGWRIYKTISQSNFLFAFLLSVYGGITLIKERSPRAVQRAKVIIWIIGPVVTIIQLYIFPFIVFDIQPMDAGATGAVVGSFISSFIWSTYLSKSKRVNLTYGIMR